MDKGLVLDKILYEEAPAKLKEILSSSINTYLGITDGTNLVKVNVKELEVKDGIATYQIDIHQPSTSSTTLNKFRFTWKTPLQSENTLASFIYPENLNEVLDKILENIDTVDVLLSKLEVSGKL